MKKSELKKLIKETIQEIDINNPVLMKMRAYKDSPHGQLDQAKKDRNKNNIQPSKPTSKHNNSLHDDIKKLSSLLSQRDQLLRDMEQEAEPEGGPIADRYGKELELIDKKLELLRKKQIQNPKSINENRDPKKDWKQEMKNFDKCITDLKQAYFDKYGK